MLIEVGSPCSLPLGLIRTHEDQTGVLGVTLQHPPTDVFAEAATEFGVTGPMAHKGYARAWRFFAHHRREPRANVEIELAIPDMMGLGAETMLGRWVKVGRPRSTDVVEERVGEGRQKQGRWDR